MAYERHARKFPGENKNNKFTRSSFLAIKRYLNTKCLIPKFPQGGFRKFTEVVQKLHLNGGYFCTETSAVFKFTPCCYYGKLYNTNVGAYIFVVVAILIQTWGDTFLSSLLYWHKYGAIHIFLTLLILTLTQTWGHRFLSWLLYWD